VEKDFQLDFTNKKLPKYESDNEETDNKKSTKKLPKYESDNEETSDESE
jgi:hypothetical protein